MKITGLKDMESYIYSKVILPLKELDIKGLEIKSPMHDGDEKYYELLLSREETGHVRFAHTYLRHETEANALHLIKLRYANSLQILADYDSRTHEVKIYEPAFTPSKGQLLMNKLIEAFNHYTPFTNIRIIKGTRDYFADIPEGVEREEYDD